MHQGTSPAFQPCHIKLCICFLYFLCRYEATVEVNGDDIAYAVAPTKKDARNQAASEALELLQNVHEV